MWGFFLLMSAESGGVDLFGEEIREPEDGRGRPAHVATDENRNKVSVLRAAGFEVLEIAAKMGVSEKTLRKYYFPELEKGALEKRAELALKLYEVAMSGNVSALKAFADLLEKGQALPPPPKPEADDKPEKLGKKKQAEADAVDAHEGTSWQGLLN